MTTQHTSDHASPRRLTAARAVALALITVAAAALAVMHFSSGSSSVSVPRGAKAGQLLLHSCTYATEDGKQAADCGTLVVPEDRTNPHSRLIALSITRVRAHTTHPGAPVFYMQGGPGITNMVFPMASRFTPNHDVVLVGYRGIDSSTRLDCPEVSSAMTGVSDLLSAPALHATAAAYRNCAARLTRDGVDLRGYNSVERVDDFEAARTALGYGKINLISESAGTRTAMIYAWRYPHSINRSVMLGVNPPGHYLYDGATTDSQIQHYSQLCAADPSCRARTGDLAATMRSLSNDLPTRWGPFAIKPGNVRLATFFALMATTSYANPLSAPQAIDDWQSAAHGDNAGLWLDSLFADQFLPNAQVWGDIPATGQLDGAFVKHYYAAGGDHGSILRNQATDFLWAGGQLTNAWPRSPEIDQYDTMRSSNVPTLMISGDVDFATPAEFATGMLRWLPNGQQVILHNLGHTTDTWNYDKPGNAKLINTYLDTGVVDRNAVKARTMSFATSPSHGRLAVIIASVLAGLAALTLLAVVRLPLRQRRRGHVGRKTSVVARSLLAPIVALGGWALAVLLVLSLWPSLPIASQPMVITSMAAPVALLVYAAWANRAWSAATRHAGICAVAGGAAFGTWLGLHAGSGLASAITAAIGAALGANLAVLVRDIVAGTSTPATPTADETPAELAPAL
jgi:pimeloyl-ACP methyl ester carboxylesterase